jgi:Cu(I)/Ag(I) efflux system membrane fusion protein
MKIIKAKSLFSNRVFKIVILVVVTFFAGYFFHALLQQNHSGHEHVHLDEKTVEQAPAWWTCSMHPQIRQPNPGKCPICFMDLIPLTAEEGDIGERQITFSQEAIKLMRSKQHLWYVNS